MSKLYMVTGAKGHLGSHIVRELVGRGESVAPLILPGDTSPALAGVAEQAIEVDIRNPLAVDAAFAQCVERAAPAEIRVIHTAGIVSIASGHQDLVEQVNVGGTDHIVQACINFGVGRLVYISSVHAIPEKPRGEAMTEVSAFDPDQVRGLYARTKARATQIVMDAVRRGLDAVVVHPSGIIGPGDYGRGHLTQMVVDYLKGRLTACVRGGYDFVDVRDVAHGTLLACDKGRAGECYILSNDYIEVIQLLDLLHRFSGRRRVRTVLPMAFAKWTAPLSELYYRLLRQPPLYTRYSLQVLDGNGAFSHAKATAELGYQPRPLEDTIAATIRWLQDQRRVQVLRP